MTRVITAGKKRPLPENSEILNRKTESEMQRGEKTITTFSYCQNRFQPKTLSIVSA
jgi:hypothetical protein